MENNEPGDNTCDEQIPTITSRPCVQFVGLHGYVDDVGGSLHGSQASRSSKNCTKPKAAER